MSLWYRRQCIIWFFVGSFFSCGHLHLFAQSTPQALRDSLNSTAKHILLNNIVDSVSADLLVQAAWEFRANDPQLAIQYADRAVQIAEQNSYNHIRIKALGYLGVLYRNIGDYFQAIQYFLKALQLSEQYGYQEEYGYSLINLSDAFGSQGDYAKAEEYTNRAIELFSSIHNPLGLGYALGTMGDNCQAQKDFSKALHYYEQAYTVRQAIKDSVGMGVCHWRLAQCFNELHRYDEALHHGFAGLFYAQKKELLVMIAGIRGVIGLSFLNKKEPQKAIHYAQPAYEIVLKFKQKHIELEIIDVLHKAYALLGQFDKAYFYANTASQIREELKNTTSIRKIATMDAISTLDKKELQLLKLQQAERDQAFLQKLLLSIIIGIVAVLLVLGVAFRISRRAQKLLEIKNAELHSANDFKLSILRMASHDLKTPLTSIMSSTEYLLHFPKERDPKERKKLNEILLMVERMTTLIKELLDNAREMSVLKINPAPFDIRKALLDTVQLYAEHAESKSILLNFIEDNFASALPFYEIIYIGDENKMRQVFDNLVSNALKYTYPHGCVDITLTHRPTAIIISIRDTGQGLTQDDIKKMFIPFQQLSATPTGGEISTGVGLSIVKQIVDIHGGTIHVHSDGKDKGALFTLSLPLTTKNS